MKEKYDVALVVGTRPNFVKAAPLLEYFEENKINTLFIHTGQHKDKKMSSNIFDDLNNLRLAFELKKPLYNNVNAVQLEPDYLTIIGLQYSY